MNGVAWSRATRVLCIRLDNMGDVLMCTPAMRALAGAHPARTLTLLASPAGAGLAPFLPEVDDVLAYEAPWVKAGEPEPGEAIVRQLRERAFEAAVIFTSFSQSALPAALLCYMAGIPLRLAYCREQPYHLLTDSVSDPEPAQGIRHEVRRQLSLVAAVGCRTQREGLSFSLRARDLAWMARRLAALGIGRHQPWVLMHPGASAPSRRYPPAQWARVAGLLAQRPGLPVVVTGDSAERALAGAILEAAGPGRDRVHSLAGELDLGRLAAAMALASVVVANNTGPAHIAAAVGTPIVDLYALTNPQHTPWQVDNRVLFHDVPCRFCYKSICPQGHHACLSMLEPERVVAAAVSLLGAGARRGRHLSRFRSMH